ncbi:MAG TPA: hypothetical protein VJR89_04305 [Polyangiales bacterium]|nr:hypothetical protein [Polyangiales bacterium]
MMPFNPSAVSAQRTAAGTGRSDPAPPAEPDDLGWDLPDEEDEDGSDDEAWDPDDDSDLGLDQDDDEAVGLDTDTGFDEGPEELELDDSGEDERWTVDSEAAEELPGADAEVISGEEYGWMGEDESAEATDEELETELDDDGLPSLDDGGAEGVEDDTDLDDFELGGLPELGSAAEEEAEGFGSENLEELAGVNLSEEAVLELVPGQPWKLLAASAMRLSRVASLPGPALALAVARGSVALSAGDGWFLGSARGGLTRLPVEAAPGHSLALAEDDGKLVFALASPAGLFVSFDGGRSFERQRQDDPPSQVGFTEHGGKLRMWVLSARGTLSFSDDAGRSWSAARLDAAVSDVLAFASDGERRLCALVKRAGRTAFGSSTDGGRRWSWTDAADSGEDQAQVLAGRGVALLAARGRLGAWQPGQSMRTLAPLLGAPSALLDEEDESFAYACASRDDQTLLVRVSTRGGTQPVVIASLSRERVGEPRQLAAVYAEGGFVTLHVATDSALLRIEASLDGDDLP